MSKAMRSLLCAMLSVVLLFTMTAWTGATVSAEEVQPRFSYTNYTFTAMDITTKGIATCHADVEGYDGITTKIHIKMQLQKYEHFWWSTLETWEATFYDVVGDLSKTATVGSGRYRVKATYTVYSGSASEEIVAYSQEDVFTMS